tara:strand:+ start:1210 stop:2088 length:879 start_codon:yes stop_codon:yes gene_type:complete
LSIIFFLILLLSNLAIAAPDGEYHPLEVVTLGKEWKQYTSRGGAARCEVKDCVCEVKPEKRLPVGSPEKSPTRRISVFFSENSHTVGKDSQIALRHFKGFYSTASFTVIGYTDGCGSMSHNKSLAEKRVNSVVKAMGSLESRVTSPVFKPEVTGTCDSASRRVDVVAHTASRLTTLLDKVPADVYLIDASGSMWGEWRSWADVVSASYKPGSRIYLSKTISCRNGQVISSVKPSGGTEIWYSYWKVLDYMSKGETLVVISDFRSDIPLTRRESVTIENKVAEKNIRVFVIQL